MSDLDELRRLAEAAPGPWKDDPEDGWVRMFGDRIPIRDRATAAYIAAANPQTILSLLDRLAALEVGVKEIAERLKPRNPERRDGHLGRRWADVDSAHERAAHLLSQKAQGQPDE